VKAGWRTLSLEECIEDVKYTRKVQRKDFLPSGRFPVVSQEEEFINGYWNEVMDVFRLNKPIVLFGDHTKSFKFVDFDFVLGADGVKLLSPRDFLQPKFFYYQLQSFEIKSLGYARHYRLLRERRLAVPSLPEQQRIVGILDRAFDGIATAKANAEKNLQNARALFESEVLSAVNSLTTPSITHTLDGCCEEIFAGGDVPKEKFSKTTSIEYSVPVVANGIERDGLYGFTSHARVSKPSITISARGTIGFCVVRREPFVPIVRLIVLTPNPQIVDVDFLFFAVRTMNFENTGTSIPQLTVPNVKFRHVRVPPLATQKFIAAKLKGFGETTQRLERLYQQKLAALDELKKSLLHQAFSGAL
jgi:type I restriction enzyme, S subunit